MRERRRPAIGFSTGKSTVTFCAVLRSRNFPSDEAPPPPSPRVPGAIVRAGCCRARGSPAPGGPALRRADRPAGTRRARRPPGTDLDRRICRRRRGLPRGDGPVPLPVGPLPAPSQGLPSREVRGQADRRGHPRPGAGARLRARARSRGVHRRSIPTAGGA